MEFMKKIELLAPAGTTEALNAAMASGADACYLGVKDFNARMRGVNFSYGQLEAAVKAAERHNKKIYVTVNTVVYERELERLASLLNFLNSLPVHAVIVQDFGTMQLVRKNFTAMRLHISTQAAAASSAAVNFFYRLGAERVVLARELTLTEIAKIRERTQCEIEVFCHGSLCVSYSGLCLFSSYLGGASANRGRCSQSCRRRYISKNEEGNFFSSKDLQAVRHIPELMRIGVDSLKIEGRMKSAEYVAAVTAAYRYVIENADDSERAVAHAEALLKSDFARRKTQFFFAERFSKDFIDSRNTAAVGLFLGTVVKRHEQFFVYSEQRLAESDAIRLQRPDDSWRTAVRLDSDSITGEGCYIKTEGVREGDHAYLYAQKAQRYPAFIPRRVKSETSSLPPVKFLPAQIQKQHRLPEGNIIVTLDPEAAIKLNALNPAMFWIELNKNSMKFLRSNKSFLPLKKEKTALYLEPFVAEERVESLDAAFETLIKMGFTHFVVNNVAHIELLRKFDSIWLTAGPWLYTHNRFAAEFLFMQKIRAITLPFEMAFNNSRHFIKKLGGSATASFIAPVFGRPELFQMRGNLHELYTFNKFKEAGAYHEGYFISANKEGSRVMPEKAFSFLHKKRDFENNGVRRFLYDFRYITERDNPAFLLSEKAAEARLSLHEFNIEKGFR
jgi:putative protease